MRPSGHRRRPPRGPGSSWQARRTPATDPAPRRSRPTCRRSAAPPAARPAQIRRCCPAPPGRRTRHTAARPRPRRRPRISARHSLLTAAATSPASGSWCVRRASAIAQPARSSSAMAASIDSGGDRCAGLQPAVMPPNSRWTCAVASWTGIPAARRASARVADRAGVERSLPPPGQVAAPGCRRRRSRRSRRRLSARRTAMRIGPPMRSPAASPTSTPRQRSSAVVKSLMVHVPACSTVRCRPGTQQANADKMTAVSPTRGAAPMTLPYTLTGDLAKEVQRRR